MVVSPPAVPAGGDVDAARFDAFWLWAGVRPQPVLARARRIYLLAAQVTAGPPVRLQAQRPSAPRIAGAAVWPVVRVETLLWPEAVHLQGAATVERWRLAGSAVQGLQIDFDARTGIWTSTPASCRTSGAASRPDCSSASPASSTGAATATRPR